MKRHNRRDFLKAIGIGTASLTLQPRTELLRYPGSADSEPG